MSVKKSTNTTFDGRSFIEIYFNLPEIGRSDLNDALRAKGFSYTTIYGWLHGRSASVANARKLMAVLRTKYRITTSAVSLFPAADKRKALAEKYEPFFKQTGNRKPWDGKVDWPSLKQQEEE